MYNFKKIAIVCITLSITSIANAVPNFWTSDSNMGITEFNLVNSKNQAISISCPSGEGNTESNEPSFTYIGNWKNFTNTMLADAENTHELSLKVDNNQVIYPHPFYWSEFLNKISKAKKIEVFSHNKLIASFQPNIKSIKETATYIKNDCRYELWR